LALKCWLFTYKQIYSEKQIKKIVDQWYSEKIHKEVIDCMHKGSAIAKVIELNNEIIGLASALISDNSAELKRIYIDPDHLHKGFGSKLLTLIEKDLKKKGFYKYYCYVHKKNHIGHNFYKKKNFTIDELKSNTENYCMIKKINIKLNRCN